MMYQKRIYDIFIQGQPKAQPRTRKGKYGNIYNPDAADGWKKTIQGYFLQKRKDTILGPVSLDVDFFFYSEKHKEGPHTIKPDIDNLMKAVMDSIKDIAIYKDDCQVCIKEVTKFWTNDKEREGMRILVSEIHEK
jgi:Holliday junction resolvase RusA-like endonuclease